MIQNIYYPFFTIQNKTTIAGSDLKNLRKFYAPILGSDAILLYEYFRDLYISNESETGFYDYDSLTYLLNMDVKRLNDARIKLESVSLISTFIDEMNKKTLFVIEKPLDSVGFKKNLILANKLINIIGKQNFERLAGKERNVYLSKAEHLFDASAKYDEVFDNDDIFNYYSSHEIDSSSLNTQQINIEIQEKLDLNNFEFPNIYEAILKTDSRFFIPRLNGQIVSERIISLIKEARESGMTDPCLNLIFFYANEVNGKIVFNYIKKIVFDLIKKEIFSFELIEKYLDSLLKYKNNVAVSKKDLYKASYLESLKKTDDIYY
ncbi:replication initiation and membrane attachment family protein [Mycoplasmopsis lipofaciens]|uniref:hypothetical protein n=1 Tax=Mycoplasmopsis lipofaciens TaxID=114884 RepID=UPI0004820A98|nr:hypothetical protein [Mycoplasmopsis lipofaciens]